MSNLGGLELAPSIPLLVAIVVGGIGWVSAIHTRRKEKADAAAVITQTALSLLAPLHLEIERLKTDIAQQSGSVQTLTTQVSTLTQRIVGLEADNRALRHENTGLRNRIGVLEHQLTDLGHTPANGTTVTPSIVTTTSTETKTITQGEQPE